MRRARPAMGWRAARGVKGSSSRCARRAGPSGRPRIGSRPISATRSAWPGCWPRASSRWSRSRQSSVSSCAIWCAAAKTSALDLMRARHRIGKFLLRREIYWEGRGEAWSRKHRSWLTWVRFADQASRATLADYLHAHDVLVARRDQVEAELAQARASAPCAHTVARLRCLRGIDTLTALGLCAEIGEWERFDHPDQLACLPGGRALRAHHRQPAPTGVDHQGRLHHARRLLVEAAWHYRRGPAVGEALERRQRGQAPQIIHIAWRAQRRLNARWRQLKDARHKPGGVVASRSPANWPATAGRSRPGLLIPTWLRRQPCRRATPSHTQARPHRSSPSTRRRLTTSR